MYISGLYIRVMVVLVVIGGAVTQCENLEFLTCKVFFGGGGCMIALGMVHT